MQMAAFGRMSPGRRVEMAMQLSEDVSRIAADGIRRRHPDYDDDQVGLALHRLRLGDEIFKRAWPNAPLLSS